MRIIRYPVTHLNRSYNAAGAASLHRRASDAAGRYLEQRARWAFFVTATHDRVVTLDESAVSLRAWARAVSVALGEHIHVGWAVEEGGRFGRAHWHALVAPWRGPLPIDADLLDRVWTEDATAGDIDIRTYIPGGGAAGYIMKADRWGYGVVCPRLRDCRRRCLAGPDPFGQ